jgi:hypothetical protein
MFNNFKIGKLPLMLFTLAVGLRFSAGGVEFIRPFYIAVFSVILKMMFSYAFPAKFSYKNEILGYPLAFIAFLIYCLSTTSWTMSIGYGLSKIGYLSFWIFAFLIFSRDIIQNFYFFNKCLIGATIAAIAIFFIQYGSPFELISQISRFYRLFADESASPVSYSRFLGLGILSSLYVFFKTKHIMTQMLVSSVIVISLLYMILTGSKGPIFALAGSLIYFVVFIMRGQRFKFIFLGVFCMAILAFSFSGSVEKYAFLAQRYIDIEHSYSDRAILMGRAIKELNNAVQIDMPKFIFGYGSGNFSSLFLSTDTAYYPHNIFIEIAYEYGVIGIIMFFIAVIIPSIKIIKIRHKDEDSKYIFLIWLYIFATTLVSGDIGRNFLLFGFSVLICAYLASKPIKRKPQDAVLKKKSRSIFFGLIAPNKNLGTL